MPPTPHVFYLFARSSSTLFVIDTCCDLGCASLALGNHLYQWLLQGFRMSVFDLVAFVVCRGAATDTWRAATTLCAHRSVQHALRSRCADGLVCVRACARVTWSVCVRVCVRGGAAGCVCAGRAGM